MRCFEYFEHRIVRYKHRGTLSTQCSSILRFIKFHGKSLGETAVYHLEKSGSREDFLEKGINLLELLECKVLFVRISSG